MKTGFNFWTNLDLNCIQTLFSWRPTIKMNPKTAARINVKEIMLKISKRLH